MGMFDYVKCEYPLPGTPLIHVSEFQTKDLDEMYLALYVITAEGKLMLGEEHIDFTGEVNFYGSNCVASGPGRYTAQGEDVEDVDYQAIFINGKITKLDQTSYSIGPSTTLPKSFGIQKISQEEKDTWKAREAESLIGKQVYVLWGGQDIGYIATVIAENEKDLVLKAPDRRYGEFEIIGRYNRDTIFFDTEAEAFAHKKARSDKWEAERKEYERVIAEKRASREVNSRD